MAKQEIPSSIKLLFNKKEPIPNGIAFIPFYPDLFLQHLYYSMAAIIFIPALLSWYYELFTETTFIVNAIAVFIGISFLIGFIIFRKKVHKRICLQAENLELRNGLFISKDHLVYRKKKKYKSFERSTIKKIRSGWVGNPDGADYKGIKIYTLNNKEFEFADEYFKKIDSEKIGSNLEKWRKTGHFSKI